jgi:hypothetical protein
MFALFRVSLHDERSHFWIFRPHVKADQKWEKKKCRFHCIEIKATSVSKNADATGFFQKNTHPFVRLGSACDARLLPRTLWKTIWKPGSQETALEKLPTHSFPSDPGFLVSRFHRLPRIGSVLENNLETSKPGDERPANPGFVFSDSKNGSGGNVR